MIGADELRTHAAPARRSTASRARRHAGDGRAVLRDATMRHGRRRDQGRAARRRLDAPDGRRRRHRQPQLQRRQPRQAQRSCSTSRRRDGQDAFRRLARRRRHPHRELPARRDARASASTTRRWPPINPRLIYASISGLRPDRARRGEGRVRSGRAGRVGHHVGDRRAGRPPVKAGVPLTDLGAGLFALVGDPRRAALSQRAPARGQHIDTSLRRGRRRAVGVGGDRVLSRRRRARSRLGSAHRMSAPYQAIRCADGYITLGAANDRLFARLCELLGHPEWATDPRVRRRHRTRVRNRDALAALIEAITATAHARALAGAVRGERHPVRADQRLRAGVRRPAGARPRAWWSRPSIRRSAACGRSARRKMSATPPVHRPPRAAARRAHRRGAARARLRRRRGSPASSELGHHRRVGPMRRGPSCVRSCSPRR